MQKIVKLLFPFLLVSGLIFNYSCLSDEEEEQRTFDDEMAELDAMLAKLIDAGYDIDTTELGVYYIYYKNDVKDKDEGPFPQEGDTCFIYYKGRLPNKTVYFYSTEDFFKDGIRKFIYKKIDIIPGLEDGIGHMNKGATIEMIIPSNLAYGANGTANIPPYSTLIYRSRMDDLRPKEQ